MKHVLSLTKKSIRRSFLLLTLAFILLATPLAEMSGSQIGLGVTNGITEVSAATAVKTFRYTLKHVVLPKEVLYSDRFHALAGDQVSFVGESNLDLEVGIVCTTDMTKKTIFVSKGKFAFGFKINKEANYRLVFSNRSNKVGYFTGAGYQTR